LELFHEGRKEGQKIIGSFVKIGFGTDGDRVKSKVLNERLDALVSVKYTTGANFVLETVVTAMGHNAATHHRVPFKNRDLKSAGL
jgi:hypothetical protein